MAVSKFVMASLTNCRPLTCAATATASSYQERLVPHPPDLIKWVRREGGFVHQAIKISQDGTNVLGLIASHDIPKGSQLIVLPDNIPLKFGDEDGVDEAHSVLVKLAQKIPGMYFFPLFVGVCAFSGCSFCLILEDCKWVLFGGWGIFTTILLHCGRNKFILMLVL